jgi:hypothetical protein
MTIMEEDVLAFLCTRVEHMFLTSCSTPCIEGPTSSSKTKASWDLLHISKKHSNYSLVHSNFSSSGESRIQIDKNITGKYEWNASHLLG